MFYLPSAKSRPEGIADPPVKNALPAGADAMRAVREVVDRIERADTPANTIRAQIGPSMVQATPTPRSPIEIAVTGQANGDDAVRPQEVRYDGPARHADQPTTTAQQRSDSVDVVLADALDEDWLDADLGNLWSPAGPKNDLPGFDRLFSWP